MIKIQGLTKFYGDFCALDDVSFEIKKGEVLGLLGPNGAGKTTTLRILTCYMLPTSGTINIRERDIQENQLEVKQQIGYLPESAPLYQDMLVYDYLNYVADIREIKPENKADRIDELVDTCGLHEVMHKPIGDLSKGFKQRVGLAHAMMGDPEILVLDEPTSGLDPNQIVEIRELIKKIGREKTVILSTHILSEVEATCDRVVIINRGKIVADGTTDTIKKSVSSEYFVNLTFQKTDFSEINTELSAISGVNNVTESESGENSTSVCLICESSNDIRPEIYNTIKKKDWTLLEFHQQTKTLENIFRELTKEN